MFMPIRLCPRGLGEDRNLIASVTGKSRIWREKPPDAESAIGTASPKVWAKACTCPRARGVSLGLFN